MPKKQEMKTNTNVDTNVTVPTNEMAEKFGGILNT